MFKKAIIGMSLSVALVSMTWAQCNCGSCGNESVAIGADYTQAGFESGCGGGCESDCGGGCDSDCYGVTDRCCTIGKCPSISVYGGGNWLQSFEEADAGDDSLDVDSGGFDSGTIFGFAVGSQVHRQVRYELDFSYRENDADSWTIQQFAGGALTGQVTEAATGTLESYSGMFNLVYDFVPRQVECWNIYAGGGIGFTQVEGNIVAVTDSYSVDDGSIAFQAIAGVNKAVSQRVDFFTEYRFLAAPNVEVRNAAGASLGDLEYYTNSVLFGLRFRR